MYAYFSRERSREVAGSNPASNNLILLCAFIYIQLNE